MNAEQRIFYLNLPHACNCRNNVSQSSEQRLESHFWLVTLELLVLPYIAANFKPNNSLATSGKPSNQSDFICLSLTGSLLIDKIQQLTRKEEFYTIKNTFSLKVDCHISERIHWALLTNTGNLSGSLISTISSQSSRLPVENSDRHRQTRKWKKEVWVQRGLDMTIFFPAGMAMHGRPNRLRRALFTLRGSPSEGFVYLSVPTTMLG